MDLRDLQQTRFQRTPRIIENTTVFDKQRQMPFIIDPFHPANAIAAPGKFIRTNRFEFDTCTTLNFRFEGLNTHTLQRIFGFRVFTVGTVTPVTLSGDNGFGNRPRMLNRQIPNLARRAGIGFLITVLDGQTAAHQQVKAHQFAVFRDRDKVHVVGMQIDIVLRRDHDRSFKLTRQIGLTEDRLFIGGRHFFLIEPDLCVSAGTRQQMFRDLLRPFIGFGVQF